MSESSQINRRAFLGKSAAVIAGGVVLPRTALSYENIVGANDRISLATSALAAAAAIST
jgi:hypothetical protein